MELEAEGDVQGRREVTVGEVDAGVRRSGLLIRSDGVKEPVVHSTQQAAAQTGLLLRVDENSLRGGGGEGVTCRSGGRIANQ